MDRTDRLLVENAGGITGQLSHGFKASRDFPGDETTQSLYRQETLLADRNRSRPGPLRATEHFAESTRMVGDHHVGRGLHFARRNARPSSFLTFTLGKIYHDLGIRRCGHRVLGIQAVTVKDEVNPAANPTLHARAERAALEAYIAATATTVTRRVKLMDRAAAGVFKAAGTPRDVAAFYAEAVTALVLERMSNPTQNVGLRLIDPGG